MTPADRRPRGVRDAREGDRDADRGRQPDLRRARRHVPADALDKEKAIYRAQMENSGKPANVIDKIVEGKLGSYYSQVVLPDQPSIRDPKMTVAEVIAAANKALGARGHGHAIRAPQGRRGGAVTTPQASGFGLQARASGFRQHAGCSRWSLEPEARAARSPPIL